MQTPSGFLDVSQTDRTTQVVTVVGRGQVTNKLTIAENRLVVKQQGFRIVEFKLHQLSINAGFLLFFNHFPTDKGNIRIEFAGKSQTGMDRGVAVR